MQKTTVYNRDTNAARTRIDGETFFRYTGSDQIASAENLGEIVPGEFSKFALRTDRVLSEDEVQRLIAIVGFYWKTMVRAKEAIKVDSYGLHGGDNTVVVFQNGLYDHGVSLSHSHNAEYRFAEFVVALNENLEAGTKVRADGTQRAAGFEKPVLVELFLNEVEESVSIAKPAVKVELPWEDNSADYFANKTADELTFSDVRLLLATLRAEQKKAQALNAKVADLEGKLSTIQAVFN